MTHNKLMTDIIEKEMANRCYEKVYPIEKGDVVLDLGCSKGFFYHLNKDKISYYLGVDGDIFSLSEFIQSLGNDNKPEILNALVDSNNHIQNYPSYFYPESKKSNAAITVTFNQLLTYVHKVDFLKVDIEGYEVEVFKDLDLFKRHVKKFAGELHIKLPGVLDILKRLKEDKDISFHLYSVDLIDITEYFWNNIDYYNEILINGCVMPNEFIKSYSTTTKRQDLIRVAVNFVNGAYISVKSDNPNIEFIASFYNNSTGDLIYSCPLGFNHWAKTSKTYFIPYRIELKNKTTGELVWSHSYDCSGKRVFICIDTKALGDTLCWLPYVEEFGKVHKCQVVCSTFLNDLVKDTYPSIEFVEPGVDVPNVYAQYTLGLYFGDGTDRHPNNPRIIPMGKIATDILGLPYKEMKMDLKINNPNRKIKDRYFCIGTESTAKAKHWNNPTGWQKVVDYLVSNGFTVISLRQNGSSELKNVIEVSGETITQCSEYLYYCEAFIGLGSGLSWLAHSLNKKVVLISGFSKPWCEFSTPYRIINEKVCNGCFNDINETFDRNDWNWCPRKKDFICTKNITSEMVINSVKQLLSDITNGC
jgi:autotransporter strand-loop-strand O-heptosyltransferase